jgi:hypothetical protein
LSYGIYVRLGRCMHNSVHIGARECVRSSSCKKSTRRAHRDSRAIGEETNGKARCVLRRKMLWSCCREDSNTVPASKSMDGFCSWKITDAKATYDDSEVGLGTIDAPQTLLVIVFQPGRERQCMSERGLGVPSKSQSLSWSQAECLGCLLRA